MNTRWVNCGFVLLTSTLALTGHSQGRDAEQRFVPFVFSKGKISSAPVSLSSALSAESPAEYVDNGNYSPRVSWYSSFRVGMRHGPCDVFMHNTSMGAIKTTQTTFDFWREFGDSGFTPSSNGLIALDYDFFKMRGSGAGAGCEVRHSEHSRGYVEYNHATLNQATLQSVHGSVLSTADAIFLRAQQRKASLEPYLTGLQTHGNASAKWVGLSWHFDPPSLPVSIDVDAPMLWGRVNAMGQAFIHTDWNMVSDKNGVVKNSAPSMAIGEYGHQTTSYRIPNLWSITTKLESYKFVKPVYYIEGIDSVAVHYAGAAWSNWPAQGQQFELLVDTTGQSLIFNTGSKSWRAGAGFGIRQINGMQHPLMLSYSFRF